MDTTRIARTTGLLGTLGGALFMAQAVMQLTGEVGHVTDSLVSAVAFCCVTAILVGMLRTGAAGPSRVGRVGLVLWIIGTASIALGATVQLVSNLSEEDNPFYAIGGLGQLIGGLIAGIAIARAGVMPGWLRWAPLGWALYYLAILPVMVVTPEGSSVSPPLEIGLGAIIAATSWGFAHSAPARAATESPGVSVGR